MSATELDGWICPKCGQTNYYHPGRCGYCPDGRRTSVDGKLDSSPTVGREKQSRLTDLSEIEDRKKIAFLGSTLLAFASWLYLIWEFHKWDAKWGAMHIGIPTLVVTLLVGGWIYRKSWFRDSAKPTRYRYLVIPLVGFLFCASAGIYFTEPVERGGIVTRSGNSVGAGTTAQIVSRRSPADRMYLK